MENFLLMQNFERSGHFNEHTPYLLLIYKLIGFLLLQDLLVEVTIISKLYDEAE